MKAYDNAHAERFVGTIRRECMDWTLMLGRRHLESVLEQYLRHYNDHRPHRSLGLGAPARRDLPVLAPSSAGRVRRTDRLGGLIHEYHRVAA